LIFIRKKLAEIPPHRNNQ